MPEPRFEVLDFSSPDTHAATAARLLGTVFAQRFRQEAKVDEPSLAKAMEMVSSIEETAVYGLVEPGRGVLGAALVAHGSNRSSSIVELAVHPSARRQGHGTRLVRHIAEQTLSRGGVYVQRSVNPNHGGWEDEYLFIRSLTSRAISEGIIMVEAAELLA
jgi:ribosomal protein S18 acetylase RimI-like enzyme